jgi:hypothetical protein
MPKNKLKVVLNLVLVCMLSCAANSALAKKDKYTAYYHLPVTQAEKAADKILRLFAYGSGRGLEGAPEWENLLDYIQQWPHTKPNMPLKYQNFFTKELIYDWSRQEQQEVLNSCGRYIEDSLCSFGFVILACSQDGAGVYLYRTIDASENHAIIALTLYGFEDEYEEYMQRVEAEGYNQEEWRGGVVYKMIKRDGKWLLDGMCCREEGKCYFSLNFHESPKLPDVIEDEQNNKSQGETKASAPN